MKKIILILISIVSLNSNAQEIHNKEFYCNYKKNIKKLELFLKANGYEKNKLDEFYHWTHMSYNCCFTKDDKKIFVLIAIDNFQLDLFADLEHFEKAECFYFSNKMKCFKNENKNNIYIIKCE